MYSPYHCLHHNTIYSVRNDWITPPERREKGGGGGGKSKKRVTFLSPNFRALGSVANLRTSSLPVIHRKETVKEARKCPSLAERERKASRAENII